MPDISIQNETEYALADAILNQIKRDALEYFGEAVRVIRVQYGIDRHAFNARTGELRFAFSPVDFGLVDTSVSHPDLYFGDAVRRIDYDEDETIDDSDDDEIEVNESDTRETSLEALAEDLDDDDVPRTQRLEDGFEAADEEADFMDEIS